MYKTKGYDARLLNPDSVAVHVGVDRDVIASRQASGDPILPEFWAWVWDGEGHDSWEDWGAARQGDEPGAHVVILTLHWEEMLDTLNGLRDIFVPSNGMHAVVSDPADWSLNQQSYRFGSDWNTLAEEEEEW